MASRFPEDSVTSDSVTLSSALEGLQLTDDGNGVYVEPKRGTVLLNSACGCFKEKLYTDVTVVVEKTCFDTHRLVLASLSDYFPPLLRMDQSSSGEVLLNNMGAEEFAIILRFAYTGEIHLTTDNVQSVLMAADYLSITAVRQACESFMANNLDVGNVCSAITFARNYSLKHLNEEAVTFFCDHLTDIYKTSDFLLLDPAFLIEQLDADDLVLYKGGVLRGMEREEVILHSVLQYLSQTPPPTKEVVGGLIRCVRLPRLTKDILKSSFKKFKNLDKNETVAYYLKKSEATAKLIENHEKPSEGDDIPPAWMRPRKLAVFKIHDGPRRYASGGQVAPASRPPRKFQTNPDLEIAQIDIWQRVWCNHPVIGGINVKYRTVGGDKIVKEYSRGTVNCKNWKKYSLVLQRGEFIIWVNIGHGYLVDALTFGTSLGRLTERMGGGGGGRMEEKPPAGTIAYLHGINCDMCNANGEQAVLNLQLQWITFD